MKLKLKSEVRHVRTKSLNLETQGADSLHQLLKKRRNTETHIVSTFHGFRVVDSTLVAKASLNVCTNQYVVVVAAV